MEYPQIRTYKFNLNQEKKKIFSATPFPFPFWREGSCCSPLPLISGMTPLDENFYHSFVALTLKGG